MAEINAYLVFNGNCAEAMRFYERALGGKLEIMTHKDSPMGAQATPENADRVIHAALKVDGGLLMASDDMAGEEFKGVNGFAVSLTYKNTADAKRAFDALSDGAQITMPFQKTFWSEGFGMLTDRFGVPWMSNTASAER